MRIVSLCPSLTELVFALGRGRELVGITDWCVHPKPEVDAVEKVGGTKNPNVARIVELAPDVVLMNDEENRLEDASALQAAGVSIASSLPRTLAETAEMVRSIGAALDAREPAEAIAVDIERRAGRVRKAALDARPVRFAYLIWRKPWMSVSRDTFASRMLELAGGVNVLGDARSRYPAIEPAALGAADPELVLLCTEPFPFKPEHADELARESGIVRDRIRIADGEYLSWHGSRTPDGIDYAARLIEDAR
ncbi:MAG: ABC transporter substrate-binding protein [Planctomycetes bacterium]|nr:ABC transporter substrate-binding protein [Planctomycetota bacterium]